MQLESRLIKTIRILEGPRDGVYHYDALNERAKYIEKCFRSLGFDVSQDEFFFNQKPYKNLIALSNNIESGNEWVLVTAHYDAVVGSPGADDNASGVAVMLEAARELGKRKGLKFAAFTLEEPQATGASFLYGSKNFVKRMKSLGARYKAVINLESVGYTSNESGSQTAPPFVKAPNVGNFIAVVGNKKSAWLMERFEEVAKRYVPELKVFKHKAIMNGYFLPQTRFSDHAPFWDAGYPAIMLTDTAMLRNPHYHTMYDTSDKLSPQFMAWITKALVHTVEGMLE